MRALMLLLSAALVVPSSIAIRAQSADVRAAIEAAGRKFEAAWAAKDGAGIGALYTADAVLMPPNAAAASGRAAVVEFWKAALAAAPGPMKLTTGEVQAHGDVAHETGTFQVSTADGTVADKGKYIVIWKREGGQWKLHRDIWNSDTAPGSM